VFLRAADYNSAFPAGGTVAASWDRQVWYDRGYAMGQEHNDKGVDIMLGPVVYHTVKGIQAAGVVACTCCCNSLKISFLHVAGTKHFIGNEQEHFRQVMSSNIDDVTLHELYLWYAVAGVQYKLLMHSGHSRRPFVLEQGLSCAHITK
jgi:beta-glucosidase